MAYLISALFFIYGLKSLSSPKTAIRGNISSMLGMALAIGVTLFHPEVKNWSWILSGLILGAVLGISIALKIQMTAMPQLVAILHSFVGLSAVLVAMGTYSFHSFHDFLILTELAVGSVIGAVTFAGSLVAFGKLQEILKSDPLSFRGQHALNFFILLGIVVLGYSFVAHGCWFSFLCMTGLAFLLGFLLVLPIGGADMPVVVSMLNSYSGWAASATGFTLNHPLLIITGALVGSSGAILSYIMCKAMNRSILSVIFGGINGSSGASTATALRDAKQSYSSVKSASSEDVAFMLENASKVVIIPGYGLAVAQAQHVVSELYALLTEKGVEVKFAIHPVAGRMPGHMNVLLAESDIPYDSVFEMDEVNSEFSSTDVGFVIGANDVVNPAAKTDLNSPLYGMPILDVYKAKHVFVSKRSMSAGYAGVDNALFYYPNCSLVFGDARATCESIVACIKGSH